MMTPPMPRRRAYWALPVAWAVVILVLTLTPQADLPPLPHWDLLSFDTAAHAGVFWVLGALTYFSARRQQAWPWLRARPSFWTFVSGTLLGAIIEVLQANIPLGRHGEWTDLLSDAIGVALGVAVAAPLLRRYD